MCWRFSKRWILLEKKKKKMEEALFCSLLLDGSLGVFVGLSGTEGAQFPSLFLGSVTGALVRDPYECLAQGRCRRGQCCGWRGRGHAGTQPRGCCRAMLGHSPAPGPGRARRRCAGKTKSNPWESCSPPATTTNAVNRISNGCFILFPRSLQLIKVPLCHSLCVYLRQWKGAVVPAAPRCRAGSLAQTH